MRSVKPERHFEKRIGMYQLKENNAQAKISGVFEALSRRLGAEPGNECPAAVTAAVLNLCQCQTCGKCVPCRIGLRQLQNLIEDVLDGAGTEETLDLIETTARTIYESADCALGYEPARFALEMIRAFRDDFLLHVHDEGCLANREASIPCTAYCPAHVDIPGYISLVENGRYADAVRLIRKDNPFPLACALVCEHPCEKACRRTNVDAAINIRGLKKTACEEAGNVEVPACAPSTGKKIAVVGGGPSGITAAYYLQLMGHQVTVFEQRKTLGGMLKYGIPNYRLPKAELQKEIDALLSSGIEVKLGVSIGTDKKLEDLRKEYDAVYVAIGAHGDKKLDIEGENHVQVIPAVKLLRAIGDGERPDFTGRRVAIIGGGNVAMDVARTSVRLGAARVDIVYRRRKEDMTALPEEVESAMQEGCEVLELMAPVKIEARDEKTLRGLWVQPQIIGKVDRGRPKPENAAKEPVLIPADIIVVAIGQAIESRPFEAEGIPTLWGRMKAVSTGEVKQLPGVFAGGDCVTGPATVIKAIAAGKLAAHNIDEYLGFAHEIARDVELPPVSFRMTQPLGRAELTERDACDRKKDFEQVENSFSKEEAYQEASRCLHCDHYGCAAFRGGRSDRW